MIDLAPGAEREPLAVELAVLIRGNMRGELQRRAFDRLRGSVAIVADDAPTALTLRFDFGRLTVHGVLVGVPDVTVRGSLADIEGLARLPFRRRVPLPVPRRGDAEGWSAVRHGASALAAGRLKIYGLVFHPRFVSRLLRVLAREA